MEVVFVTHPEVQVEPAVPVPRWVLSDLGVSRIATMLRAGWVERIGTVASSTEHKAWQSAAPLADRLARPLWLLSELGENDRSSTGYLPPDEFQDVADGFFAWPDQEIRGWERARDAQARIVRAIECVLACASDRGDVAIVSHGGVGALLLCHLLAAPIDRAYDQPGGGGGQLFRFDARTRSVIHCWRPIDAPETV